VVAHRRTDTQMGRRTERQHCDIISLTLLFRKVGKKTTCYEILETPAWKDYSKRSKKQRMDEA
jgi:hypothetical protein